MTLSSPPAEIPRQDALTRQRSMDWVLPMKGQFCVLQICPADFSVSLCWSTFYMSKNYLSAEYQYAIQWLFLCSLLSAHVPLPFAPARRDAWRFSTLRTAMGAFYSTSEFLRDTYGIHSCLTWLIQEKELLQPFAHFQNKFEILPLPQISPSPLSHFHVGSWMPRYRLRLIPWSTRSMKVSDEGTLGFLRWCSKLCEYDNGKICHAEKHLFVQKKNVNTSKADSDLQWFKCMKLQIDHCCWPLVCA